ncbi:hypothetical protein FXB85_00730 [Aggregatibacter actinomycetemcomitans]|nr:hypothetical protein FXB85_00730 [Aggregatibacter actinomycetemcomitans]
MLVQESSKEHTPDKPLFFAWLQFFSRKFSNSLRSNRRKFPKNCKSLRRLIRGPHLFEHYSGKVRLFF